MGGTVPHRSVKAIPYNAGFLRPDIDGERSMIIVLMVTDEDDCSAATSQIFTPYYEYDPSDPLSSQPLGLRCFYNGDRLSPVDRFVAGLRWLRPGNEALVMFTAIAGIPQEMADAATHVDFTDPDAREGYYRLLLDHPAMQERPDPTSPPQSQRLMPSCGRDVTRAYPPRRIVEAARGFGANGAVQSICNDDLGPAVAAILARVAERMRTPCL